MFLLLFWGGGLAVWGLFGPSAVLLFWLAVLVASEINDTERR